MKEMLQGKVSVIVPAYNAARLLERCVRSITGQTYPALEVIVVDDGSKDDTGKIADQLAAEDSRIRVVHKTNGGVSAARNDALKLVEGEWITFVDSDDYLEPDFLRSLLDGEVADLVIGGYHTVGANEIPSANYPTDTAHSPEAIKRALEARLTDMTFLCPWGKLFRTSLVRSLRLIFNTEMKVGEDVVFVWSYLAHCSSLAFKQGQGYDYYTEPGADFKYALDETVSLQPIERILGVLDGLKRNFGMDTEHARCHVLNYYIWLFKLYVNRNYLLRDLARMKNFFYYPLILDYYKTYRRTSKDKLLVYLLLKLRLSGVLYLMIKLYY